MIAANNNGIIEIFSKSYSCQSISEEDIEFGNCTC